MIEYLGILFICCIVAGIIMMIAALISDSDDTMLAGTIILIIGVLAGLIFGVIASIEFTNACEEAGGYTYSDSEGENMYCSVEIPD